MTLLRQSGILFTSKNMRRTKIMKKIIAIVMSLVLFAGVAMLAGCGKKEEKKTLILATSADFPPYEFVGDDGAYAGIDIEVSKLIAEKLGMELQVENMDFNSVISSVQTGKADIGMSGITVTDERKQSVDFTDSYATGVQVIIVKEGSAIKTVDDLYVTGAKYKIGVQLATTGDIYISGDIEDKKMSCSVEEYKTGADAVAALVAGKIDCVVIDNEPAKSFVAANSGLKILDTEYVTEDYAICVSKENTELRDQINTALKELIADGSVQKVVDKYISAE